MLTVMLVVLAGGLVVILRVEDRLSRVLESFEKSDTSGTQYLAIWRGA